MNSNHADRFLVGLLLALWLGGCANSARTASEPPVRSWWPDGSQWIRSVRKSAVNPAILVPLAGAVLIQAADWDERISDWAIDTTPLFGSNDAANQASDTLVTGCHIAMVASALAVPGNGSPWKTKAGRLTAGYGSMLIADTLTGAGKAYFKRERPLGSGRDGFPSRHSTLAFSYATSAAYNVDRLEISVPWRRVTQWGITMTAAAGAWARVEGGNHYPTDILVGGVIGGFVSAVINEAFFGNASPIQVSAVADAGQGVCFKVRMAY